MPTILAVSLSDESVAFASVRCERGGDPILGRFLEIPRSTFHPPSEESGENLLTIPPSINIPDAVDDFINREKFSESICLFQPKRFFSEVLTYPFENTAKVEQVAPLELEEALPFEVGDYTIEPIHLKRKEIENPTVDRDFLVLGVESDNIRSELEFLKQLQIDPAVLIPKVSSIALLAKFLPDNLCEGVSAIISVEQSRLLFVLTNNSEPLLMRDIYTKSEDKAMTEVLPTLLSASRISPPNKALFLGRPFSLNIKGIESHQITLAELGFKSEDQDGAGLCTEVMLAVVAGRVNKIPMPNFRKGLFRYRGNLRNYIEPFLDDKSYVLTFIGVLITWIAVTFYTSATEISAINTRAKELISSSFPGQSIPPGNELGFVQSKLDNLEQTMKGLGSISSLSPLEALTELSEVIPSGIDLAIDSLATTQLGVQFSGSVGDMGTVGRLIGALEKRNKFCDIKVDPRGSLPGGVRVRIVGELKYCP